MGLAKAGKDSTDSRPGTTFFYVTVHDLIADRIRAGELPPGTVLKEAQVSGQLGMSRAPVRRALAMLAEGGLITPARGQGYVVGQSSRPLRLPSRRLHEILTAQADGIERTASWERIFAQVADTVTACMPFGTFRIQEAELGNHHHVSRTVAREVLWRLMDRRLVEKNRRSHWIVGQMTARDLRDTLHMRRLLEPEALALVAPDWAGPRAGALLAEVEAAIDGFPACGAAGVDRLDQAMFGEMFEGVRNSRLLGSIRRNQLSLLVPRLFRRHFPIIDDLPALREYAGILRHLRQAEIGAARDLLHAHLVRVEALVLARLRVLSLLSPPDLAPYLIPVYRDGDG